MEVVLSVKIKLKDIDSTTFDLFSSTMEAYTKALNYTSKYAAENNLYLAPQKVLHSNVYYNIRSQFGLPSQMACSVSKDVKAKYKSLKSNKTLYKTKKGKPTNELNVPEFKKDILNLVYKRDFSFTKNGYISIGTLNGRTKVSYYKNNYVNQFINCSDWEYGGAILKKYKNNLYLLLTVSREIETFTPNTVGVDLGLNFLATAYNGTSTTFYSGKKVKEYRAHYKKLRRELQSKGTKSAKRRLAAINQRENRFMNDVNHCVTKALVLNNPNSLFIVEDLKSVRNSLVKVKKNDRYYMVSWSYGDFIEKLSYKALLHNSLVVEVNPKYTSQTCPICGHRDKKNRNKKLHTFKCRNCNYTSNDDRIGAMNLYNKRSEIT